MDIYLDNAATTPLAKANESEFVANPSSPHLLGISAERNLSAAREIFASIISCSPSEITFTSGGTEANNIALIGHALANRRKQITFIANPWEHPSILEPLKFIQEQELGKVLIAPIENYTGSEQTLATISHVNHETGDVNNISEISQKIKSASPNTAILVDGVQGFCKEPLCTKHVDMMSISGHKCHGSTGVGVLMVKKHIQLKPIMYGGSQEQKLRPGTENTASIMQFANIAKQLHANIAVNNEHVAKMKHELASHITNISGVEINALSSDVSPYILNLSFLGIKGEVLVHLLSQKGVHASMGAACNSRKKTKSSLEYMGFSKERAESAVRFSFSHLNTMEEISTAKTIIIDCVNQMQKIFEHE